MSRKRSRFHLPEVLVFLALPLLAASTAEDPYILETNQLPDDVRLFPAVGNGHLATNVFSDAVFVNGVYNGYLGDSHRARIRSLFSSQWDACPGAGSSLFRLDMRNAYVEEVRTCAEVTVTSRVYAHASLDRVLVSEVIVVRNAGSSGGDVVVERIDRSGQESDDDFLWQPVQQIDDTTFYKVGTTLTAETDTSSTITTHVFYNANPPDSITLSSIQNSQVTVFLLTADTDAATAQAQFDEAKFLLSDTSGNILRQTHIDTWTTTWNSGNIDLEGNGVDTFLKESIKASFYYLYSSLPSIDADVSNFYGLSPGGLARGALGEDYQGHVFWDMETWMFPPILMFRPDLAKAMLKYRIQGIGEAQARSQEGGYNGARFPWESAFTGAEVTPDICPECRENQQHITGDISWATRTFIALTRDLEWLGQRQPGNDFTGNELIVEMAKFWESRPSFNDEKQQWEINHIMPPDEHQTDANNSVYTNLVANLAVNTARWTTCLTEGEASATSTIPDSWLEKMKNLVFLFNDEYRYHEEYEGFDDQYRTGTLDERGIKQADVVLLGFPLLWQMPDDVRRNDLEIYEPITNPDGPAMTWGIFAINWMELGDQAKSEELFTRSYAPYVKPPFNVWTETQNGVGAVNFITGAGGFLQTLIFGYAGLRVYPYYIEFVDTFLPPNTDALNLVGLQYLGAQFDLRLTADEVTFTCNQPSSTDLEVEFDSGSTFAFVCDGSPRRYGRDGFQLRSTTVPSCEAPKDEMNVDYGPPSLISQLKYFRDRVIRILRNTLP